MTPKFGTKQRRYTAQFTCQACGEPSSMLLSLYRLIYFFRYACPDCERLQAKQDRIAGLTAHA